MNSVNSGKPSNEIIILAGGLGTRLRSVVSILPKCMAPVNNKPFIFYVITYFFQQGITDFIFSLGYKHEFVTEYLDTLTNKNSKFIFKYSVEEEPLGTGGALKKACSLINSENVFVANGDTLFKADPLLLKNQHYIKNSDCTLTLKPMKNFNRYGSIEIDEDDLIKNISEKKYHQQGLINGGFYMLNVSAFLSESLPEKFSFETDYLEKFFIRRKMFGLVQDEYFIDIGIPEDYEKAQEELRNTEHENRIQEIEGSIQEIGDSI